MKEQLVRMIAIIIVGMLYSCGSTNYPPLNVVSKVDVQRYIGKWYEIAHLPFKY